MVDVMELGWLAAAIVVPLAFNPWGCNAFELPKSLLLKALVLGMALVAFVRVVERRGRRDRWPKSLLPAGVLGGALALATVTSFNPRLSLWGTYERQQGLLTLFAYLALFAMTALGVRARDQVERLLKAIAWGSAPVVLYGLFQALGLDPLDWRTDAASPILSTIGRANFLGAYLLLVLPPTLGCLLLARRRWPYGLLLALQLLALALTQARAAWVGLGVAMLLGALLWSALARDRRPALAALALLLLAVGVVILFQSSSDSAAFLARLPGLDRLAALTRTDAGSPAARLTIWRATLPLLAERPWLGYGPETMRPVFARVFPPQLVYYQGRHTPVDRAHNLWLDVGMSAGLAGLLALGALLLGFGRLAWRGLRAGDRWERVVWAALALAVAGHLADLQFSFDLTASATIFWLLLGAGAALGQGGEASPPVKAPGSKSARLPYLLPTLAVVALVGGLILRPTLADVACWQAQRPGRSPDERRTSAERAVRWWPLEPEYRMRLAWLYLESDRPSAAEGQLEAANDLDPGDPRVWAALGELYALWGEAEPARYDQAASAYRRALALAPDVAAYHTALGLILARQGRPEGGVIELERAVALDATDGVAFRYLAELYQLLGRGGQAAWAWREAVRWGGEE